jgi:hypothetical protein
MFRDSQGHETVLYRFTGREDVQYPISALVQYKKGNLYGTYADGSEGYGTFFRETFRLRSLIM